MKLLKVHWHEWYLHLIIHKSPKWEVYVCHIGWSGWPWNVAAKTYPSCTECLDQVSLHIPDSWESHLVAKSQCLHPAEKQGSAPAYPATVTHNGSIGEKEWSINCLQLIEQKTINFGQYHTYFTTWCGFCHPQIIRLWQLTFHNKWKVALSLSTILSKNKLSSQRKLSVSVKKSLPNMVDHWALSPAAV